MENICPKLNYVQKGKGKHLLFLHGWGGSINSFKNLINEFSKDFTVTCVDFYGFGKSPDPPYPYGVSDYVEGIIALLNELNINKTHIIAHSFGGRVAIKLAALYPELVDRLILVDSAGIKPRRSIKYYYRVFRYKLAKKLKRDTQKYGSKDYKALNDVMRATFVKVVNENLLMFSKHIKVKTLIVWGEKDKETPLYMAKKLEKNIKNSRLVVLKGAGHFSYVDKYAQFLLIADRFLEEQP